MSQRTIYTILFRNTSKGASSTPARRPEVRSDESRGRRAGGRGAEKVPDETGDERAIDESDGREIAVVPKKPIKT